MEPLPERPSDWPRHVAIIMDGNGRWARRRLLPRIEGHRQGAKAVRRAIEFCRHHRIEFLTLYAFSTENWQRPTSEVKGLMKLLAQFIDSELDELHANDIRLHTIGDLSRLPSHLAERVRAAIRKTSNNRAMVLNIALSYSGRLEIVQAARAIAEAVKSGAVAAEEITADLFATYLFTEGLPDPDLLIRTGGELRISNFLLWQAAYAELFFTPTLWPDFDDVVFREAIDEYRSRQRRFGLTSEQVGSGQGAV